MDCTADCDATAYRAQIQSVVTLAALVVTPMENVGAVLKGLRGLLYVQRGVRSVLEVGVQGGTCAIVSASEVADVEDVTRCKLLLLDPQVCGAGVVSGTPFVWPPVASSAAGTAFGLPPVLAAALARTEVQCSVSLTTHDVTLTYKNYTMPEILRMVLPHTGDGKDLVALSGFEQVGHIAHVNLSADHVLYQHVIGQVIMDCCPTVDVVVNKVDRISSVFREFKMDIIANRHPSAGDPTPDPKAREEALNALLTATVRQHGCLFRVPYNRVYWNSRLSHEHTRLVEQMVQGDMLFDVMAGIGPFAIPAAKRAVSVLANDLNPVAAEYMQTNRELNHVGCTDMLVFNLDGREFMNLILYESVMGLNKTPCHGRRHVVMNLPAIAVEFLDVFAPSNTSSPWQHVPSKAFPKAIDKNVLFHVYCFTPATDVLGDAVRQVEHYLGYTLEARNKESVVMVRDVAPTKRMACVSFTLPDAFWAHQSRCSVADTSPAKMPRLE